MASEVGEVASTLSYYAHPVIWLSLLPTVLRTPCALAGTVMAYSLSSYAHAVHWLVLKELTPHRPTHKLCSCR
eukprot:3863603-Rhodomonas_salina.1